MVKELNKFKRVTQDRLYFPNSNLPIGITFKDKQEATPIHAHDFIEIAIVTNGCANHSYMGNEYSVRKGDVFVIYQNCWHSYSEVDQLDLINIIFYSPDNIPMLESFFEHPGYRALFILETGLREKRKFENLLKLSHRELKEIMSLAEQLEKTLHRKERFDSVPAIINFLHIIGYLCNSYIYNDFNSKKAPLVQISKAINHIEEHFHEELEVQDLAKIANMSLSTFQRHFLSSTGMTAVAYITEQRLSKACKMLEAGTMNITETAFAAGYKDSSYFSRIFRNKTGMTPRQYKKESEISKTNKIDF